MGGAKPLRQPIDVSGQVVRYWTQVTDRSVPSFTLFAHQDIGIQKFLDRELKPDDRSMGQISAVYVPPGNSFQSRPNYWSGRPSPLRIDFAIVAQRQSWPERDTSLWSQTTYAPSSAAQCAHRIPNAALASHTWIGKSKFRAYPGALRDILTAQKHVLFTVCPG
jgi:hypothetical protein